MRALARPGRVRVAPGPRRGRRGAGHQRHRRPGRHRSRARPTRARPAARRTPAAAPPPAGRRPPGGGSGPQGATARGPARTPPPAPPRPAAATASRTRPASPTPRSRWRTSPTSPARCPASSSRPRRRRARTRRTSTPATTSAAASSTWCCSTRRADSGADQQAYTKACDEAFAAVGSMSAFDAGGAATAEQCGLPDIRSTAVNPERNDCSTCFGAQAIDPGPDPERGAQVLPQDRAGGHPEGRDALHQRRRRAGQRAGVRRGRREERLERGLRRGHRRLGVQLRAVRPGDEGQGRQAGAVRRARTRTPSSSSRPCSSRASSPKVFLQDATIYDARYVEQAGDDGDGSYVYMNNQMFERTSIQEMALYQSWLQQVKPGATPDLLRPLRLVRDPAVRRAGGRARRQARPQDRWSPRCARSTTGPATGCTSRSTSAPRQTAECTMIIQLNGGKWSQKSPGKFICGPHHGDGAEPMTSLLVVHHPRPLHRGGVRDRGQRPGADLHDDPRLQHRPRRVRHGDGLRVLGLQPAPGPADVAVAGARARRGRARHRLAGPALRHPRPGRGPGQRRRSSSPSACSSA